MHISDSLPPSLALPDSESLSDCDYFNNQSVLTKLLFNSFLQILKIVIVVVVVVVVVI